jgi:radical SAM protein with 4Fe4S-binding SPASM domain
MFERAISEGSAFALDRRNFDYLPDEMAVVWRSAFLKARGRPVPGPRKLIVELLNSCNLDCPMCRVGQHGIDLTRDMPLAVFEKLLEDVHTAKTVRLNGLGESTLLPNFSDYVAVLKKRGISIELITNGSGRVSDYSAVAAAGGHIFVSWDAAEPRLFEQLRRPAQWDECRSRLVEIARSVAGQGKCSLIFTLQKANIGELRGIVALADELNLSSVQMNVAKTPTTHWLSANILQIQTDVAAAMKMAAGSSVVLFVPAKLGETALAGGQATAASGCSAPWEEAVIRWNGDVQVCNMFNPYTYGNIHRHPFSHIWHSTFAQVFREKLNGDHRHPYCIGCVYMQSAYA